MRSTKLLILFLALGIFFALPKVVWAEQINDYQVEIAVKADSSILVEEKIDYDFGAEQRHGIYRDIPYKYQARGGNYKLEIEVWSVSDENGRAVNFETSQNSGSLKIKIGDANSLVTGQKTYTIKYQVDGAINYFPDHDELYWNVTGNYWTVPIEGAEAQVRLNGFGGDLAAVGTTCYAGGLGVTDSSQCQASRLGGEINFSSAKLYAGEGLTIVVGWPKGFTKEPTFLARILKIAKDNGIILLPILVFIFLYLYWRKNGKDPVGRVTIIAEYEAPVGILPAEAGVVYDEKYDTKDLTATIIDLALRGYLKIVETKEAEKNILGAESVRGWKLVKIKEWDNNYSYGRGLYEYFFANKKEVSLAELGEDKNFAYKVEETRIEVEEAVVTKKWFKKDPSWARSKLIMASVMFLFWAVVLFFEASSNWIAFICLLVCAILFFIFGWLMPQKTVEGVLMKEKLEGFKLFLSVTEKDRVSFHFSPSAHPEKFAEYLPWAIIFGVEKEWAEVFKGIDLPQPDWYVGTWAGNYTALAMTDSLGSFKNSFAKAGMAGAAAGSSGMGGGGASGGGFGGGGGGSW